jgi:hypothetical protein
MASDSLASLAGKAGAHRLHALYDSRELTKNARTAADRRFYDQTDPALPETERQRRAAHLRKAYFAELALRSAIARGKRRDP